MVDDLGAPQACRSRVTEAVLRGTWVTDPDGQVNVSALVGTKIW